MLGGLVINSTYKDKRNSGNHDIIDHINILKYLNTMMQDFNDPSGTTLPYVLAFAIYSHKFARKWARH